MQYKALSLFCFGGLLTLTAPSALGCKALAKTELERVFCKVKARSPASLPYAFNEFRKNPPVTQRLLLKRPAAKAGISLPAVKRKPTGQPNSASNPGRGQKGEPKKAGSGAQSGYAQATSGRVVKKGKVPEAVAVSHSAAGRSDSLPGCRLAGRKIMCAEGNYALLDNQPNSALEVGAFEQNLLLPRYTGADNDSVAVRGYVVESYREYIKKMAGLGLAGVTMSFTKFFHTHREVVSKGANFAARMETMYEFLKKDKASMGAPRSHDKHLPKGIKSCQRLSAQWIVCDDVKRNWVYRSARGDSSLFK